MGDFHSFDYGDQVGLSTTKDTRNQIILSIALGVSALIAFCILRPRWPGLYAARKKHKDEASSLPELPDTLLGWILPLYRITDQQVLASAGLDAYVFLAFFKMAAKYLAITLFFSLVVIKPVHDAYEVDDDKDGKTHHNKTAPRMDYDGLSTKRSIRLDSLHSMAPYIPEGFETDYLWMYLVFVYFFSIIALHMIISNTRKIIEIRQEYLGSQTTITDRTIRLSGIPKDLQSEDKIKAFMEELDIGKVESVTLCKNWKELDDMIYKRNDLLRRLEEAWTVHLGYRRIERNLETLPITQPLPPGPHVSGHDDEERGRLLDPNTQAHVTPYERERPKITLRYGKLWLQSKHVDAIDYYEEKLRVTDDGIRELRDKDFAPTRLAFVTMDSVAACQMAVQAVLDPSPLSLLANLSPAPADVIWPNTYLSRGHRMFRAWSITAVVAVLTVFWSALLVPVATALEVDTIKRVLPEFAKWLKHHTFAQSLVQTQLPTLLTSLLVVLVPYLYYWLSTLQGMISQGDIELSLISKNFFFTIFNFFVIFTVLGTAADFVKDLNDSLKDTTRIAWKLAQALQSRSNFYTNFIILQGLGLFPLRLLEIGSVFMYPIMLIGAKTPRDYAELVQPPIFSYGFYLPQTLLIFIICLVYSVLRDSWKVLLSGLAYFLIGGFVHKYQLLYAMDHKQHSTGRSWIMMCDRVLVGLVLFQLTVGGQLALKHAPYRSAAVVPLLFATVWTAYVYGRTYKPLMTFIALKSVRRAEQADDYGFTDEEEVPEDLARWRYDSEAAGQTVDESHETGLRFINPSLIAPLEKVWIADKAMNGGAGHRGNGGVEGDDIA